jgi:hypothetical protein
MHPEIHRQVTQARTADLYRKAEHDRLVRAALQARRVRARRDARAAPSRLATVITRKVPALFAALNRRAGESGNSA